MNNEPREYSDEERYKALQVKEERAWESKCTRCGACCGATDSDPCENLLFLPDGKYACKIYETRFGLRQTISGKKFHCVPIRDILHINWTGDSCCGYKK